MKIELSRHEPRVVTSAQDRSDSLCQDVLSKLTKK